MTDGDYIQLFADAADLPERADVFLARKLPDTIGVAVSRERLKSLFQSACVFQNGSPLKPKSKIREGAVEIRLTLEKLREIAAAAGRAIGIEPAEIPLDVLYEDESLIVINKAAGMSVHPSPTDFAPTVAAALMHRYGVTIEQADFESARAAHRMEQEIFASTPSSNDLEEPADSGGKNRFDNGGDFEIEDSDNARPDAVPGHQDAVEALKSALLAKKIGIVHRLDKMTSGCLIVARDAQAHAFLASKFEKREVEKEYIAIVAGTPPSPAGIIDLPIIRHPRERMKYVAVAHGEGGREALTEYESLVDGFGLAVLRLKIHTGRTHQIRVHLKSIGLEIIGDDLYGTSANRNFLRLMCDGEGRGGNKAWQEFREKIGAEKSRELAGEFGFNGMKSTAGQMLHARRIAFPHPFSGEQMEFSAPPPSVFTFLAAAIGYLERA